jgi:hypothetical protein
MSGDTDIISSLENYHLILVLLVEVAVVVALERPYMTPDVVVVSVSNN